MLSPVSIYVLPTEENLPPRAVIGSSVETDEGEAIEGTIATWSADTGTWIFPSGIPLPSDLANAVTEHAKNLGVEW